MPLMAGAERVTVPEASRRMDLPGDEIYQLIFGGEIAAEPTLDRGVLVSVESIERWLQEHGPASPRPPRRS